MAQLIQGLPTLEFEDTRTHEEMISFNEISDAIQQLSPGRAPRVDGLSAELSAFWGIIRKRLLSFMNVTGEDNYQTLVKGWCHQSCLKRET